MRDITLGIPHPNFLLKCDEFGRPSRLPEAGGRTPRPGNDRRLEVGHPNLLLVADGSGNLSGFPERG
jgi:hypothetical protein